MALLVIDESMSTRIGTELRRRGRSACSLASLGLRGLEDEPMLATLVDVVDEPFVLVTADDAMPAAHGDVIAETGTTVATLDTRWQRTGLAQEEDKSEAVHRWAHAMADQAARSVRRYSPARHRQWVPLGRVR